MEFVGRIVKKEFNGLGVYTGTVRSYDSSSGFFEIVYENGNSEKLELAEVVELVQETIRARSRVGRKPTKRPRVERKREIAGYSSGNEGAQDGNERFGVGSEGNSIINVDLNDGFVENFRDSENFDVNLTGNVDLNRGYDETLGRDCVSIMDFNGQVGSLRNGIDLNAGCDSNLNEGSDLINVNVDYEENFSKRRRGYIDLNVVAKCDLDEIGGSGSDMQKRDRGFDLNLKVEEENSKQDMDIQSIGFNCCPAAQEPGNLDETCFTEDDANAELKEVHVAEVSCARFIEEIRKQNGVSGQEFHAHDSDGLRLKRGLAEFYGKAVDMSRSDMGSSYEYGSGQRKRRKVLDNSNFVTETKLRRSTRRLSAKNHITNTTSCLVDDLSPSPAVSGLTEEKEVITGSIVVEEAVILPPKLELPPSSHNLNLDGVPLLDVFSIYACLRSFSTLLFLSPFELEDFVESWNCESSSSLFDCIHVSLLQTLRKHLEQLSNEGHQSAKDCLRSLNWDMLDVITYPLFMVEYLLFNDIGLNPKLDLSRLNLFRNEYYKQPVTVKIEILRALCDEMIEVEAVRSEINRRSMASEPEMDFDRNTNRRVGRKNRLAMEMNDDGSFLNDDIIDDLADWNSDECFLCKMDGNLLCCDGCPAAYHSKCISVASHLLPEGDWYCPECAFDRLKPGVKPRKALRGAELLGTDPHGRQYYSCCGYLLVLDADGLESSCTYYHMNDMNRVLEVLKPSYNFYSGIIKAIYKQWDIHIGLNRSASYMNSQMSVCLDDVAMEENQTDNEGKRETKHITRNSGNLPFKNRLEELAETIQNVNVDGACNNSSNMKTRKGSKPEMPCRTGYKNCYRFARASSLIAEELMRKRSDQASELKSEQDIISTQVKAISMKSDKFHWRDVQSLYLDAWKEKCGWCFSCKTLADDTANDTDCLFNMSLGPVRGLPGSEMTNLRSNNKKGHLIDIMCQIISIESRLQGLLLGPWLDPQFSMLWRECVRKASSISSLKYLFLKLEENLHHRVLSPEWLKHIDSAVNVGSALHIVIASTRACSKNAIGKKRSSFTDSVANPSRKIESGLSMCWWRGGRLSRELFNWKVLPQSLVSKAARQAGRMKIPGILYPENSESPRRSKSVAWRAAVESSMSPEQLGLQIRELDSNIRWDEVENTHLLPILDKEARKSVRLFKKAIVRRKCLEADNVKYLLDFGKRRNIPDVVLRNGTMIEESSSGRKRYWVNESYVPLHLLKGFEETRIARKTGKVGSVRLSEAAAAMKRSTKEKGFLYLFAKVERAEYSWCGHCNKEVLIREAVCCNFCKGFFHKQHIKKSDGSNPTCYRCHGGMIVKTETQIGKSGKRRGRPRKSFGLQTQKHKKVTLTCKPRRLKNTKTSTVTEEMTLRLRSRKKVVTVLPLRRSARRLRARYVSQQQERNKKAEADKKQIGKAKRGRGRPRKVKEEISWRKERTKANFSYWFNGLLLSRKPSDERVMRFIKDRYFIASEHSASDHDLPKCALCLTEGSTSGLSYVACEICGGWFHGDAYGLDDENICKLIGFRCHICRDRPSVVCPHARSMKINESKVVQA